MNQTILCWVGLLVAPAYLAMAVVAHLSTLFPFLKQLTSYGKTRLQTGNGQEQQQQQLHWWQSESVYVPKRFFLHFYVVGLLSLVVFVWQEQQQQGIFYTTPTVTAMSLAIHLSRRCYECLHVHKYSPNSKMHLGVYLGGIFHYLFLQTLPLMKMNL